MAENSYLSRVSPEARTFFTVSLLFVAAWTVFLSGVPFEWDLDRGDVRRRLTAGLLSLETHHLLARPALMVVFGCLLRLSGLLRGRVELLVLAGFCGGIELMQALFVNRHSRAGDGAVALASGYAGLLLAPAVARLIGRLRAADWDPLVAAARALTAGLAMLLVFTIAASYASGSLVNWDPRYPLVIGDEATGQRTWSGCVTDVTIVPGEASAGSTGPAAASVQAPVSERDARGCLPVGVLLTAEQTGPLVDAIVARGAFIVDLSIADYARDQRGPARLVSLSRGPYHRNFTVGQSGDDLILRVRSPINGANGTSNEARWPNVFAGGEPLQLQVIYRDGRAWLSVKGGPPLVPDYVAGVTLDPLVTLGASLGWLSVLVLIPAGFYAWWSGFTARPPGRLALGGLCAFLLALVGGWAGSYLYAAPFGSALPAAWSLVLVPLASRAAALSGNRSRE